MKFQKLSWEKYDEKNNVINLKQSYAIILWKDR